MMLMSAPGNREDGYILLDVLIALMLISIGFGSVFAALRTGADFTVRYEEKVLSQLEERNAAASEIF